MLDEERPVKEEVVPQVPARAGEVVTPAVPRAPGGIEPDVVVETGDGRNGRWGDHVPL